MYKINKTLRNLIKKSHASMLYFTYQNKTTNKNKVHINKLLIYLSAFSTIYLKYKKI